MLTLVDNDVVKKFARYDLFGELSSMAGGIDSLRILSTLRFIFQLHDIDRARRFLVEDESFRRINEFVEAVQVLDEPQNPDVIARLASVDEIDHGEVTLIAYNLWQSESLTFTGDKRCIMALAGSSDLKDLTDQLKGRIKCIEQVVAEFVIEHGAEAIGRKINGISGCDTALEICFRSSNPGHDPLEGLASYYGDLSKQTGDLLAPFPEPA